MTRFLSKMTWKDKLYETWQTKFLFNWGDFHSAHYMKENMGFHISINIKLMDFIINFVVWRKVNAQCIVRRLYSDHSQQSSAYNHYCPFINNLGRLVNYRL